MGIRRFEIRRFGWESCTVSGDLVPFCKHCQQTFGGNRWSFFLIPTGFPSERERKEFGSFLSRRKGPATMSQIGVVKFSYLAYLSQPASDRPIYRLLRQHPVRRIVELGLGNGVRTQRILELALALQPDVEIRYAGIDLFEARPASQPGLSLKAAYKLLRQWPVQSQLVPGDPFTALKRVANDLPGTDLLVIAADQDPVPLSRAWGLVPRMLHETSLVFLERTVKKQKCFELLSRPELDALTLASRRQARAA
jgi:hypothetical protein